MPKDLYKEGQEIVLYANPSHQGTVEQNQEPGSKSVPVRWEDPEGDFSANALDHEIMDKALYRQFHPELPE